MSTAIHLFDPAIRSNPFPLYAELRRHRPVCQVEPGGLWAVSRHADVRAVLKTHNPFSSAGFQAQLQPPWLPVQNPLSRSLLMLDPPAHTRLRNLVNKAFSPRNVARLESAVKALVAPKVERLRQLGDTDFVAELALVLPTEVICALLGIDPSRSFELKGWVEDLANISPLPPEPARLAQISASVNALTSYIQQLVEDHRRRPVEGVWGDLIAADVDGQHLSDEELVAFGGVLLAAGAETTTGLLASCARLLGERPDLWARLRGQPDLIPRFIEEMLRYDPPVHGDLRVTIAETEIAGVRLGPGSAIITLLAAANRDETVFPDPDTFDLDRDTQAHIAFGTGPHFCIGAALARLEAKVVLEHLVARCAGLETLPGALEWSTSLTVRSLKNLPLRVLPA